MQIEFNLLKLCRVCGGEGENCINIFERMHKEVVRQIEDIIGSKLKCNKYMPKMMCSNCHTHLNAAYDFRKLCLQSQEYFSSQKFKEQAKMSTKDETPLNENIEEVEKAPQIEFVTIDEYSQEYTEPTELPTESIKTEPNCLNFDRGKDDGEIVPEKRKPPKNITKSKRKAIRMEDTIICEQCGNQFTCRNQFINHQKRHIGEKPFQCEICSNKFFTHSELKRHMRRHTGERPFPCRHCNRRFTDYSTRLKHERTHTNERPFQCIQCGKAFTTTYILKNHLLTHTGQREFSCKICDKYFVRHTHLVVHCRSLLHKQNEGKYSKADGNNCSDSAENNT